MFRLLLLAHQFIKNSSLVANLGLAQYPRHDIVFNRNSFNFAEALRLGVVPTDDFFRVLVALGGFFNQGTNLFRRGLQLFRLDYFSKDQAKCDATLCLVGKPFRLDREILGLHAALFHVPGRELPRVLQELQATLKPGGVLFSSNPHGRNEEGWNRGRYGAYHDPETWRRFGAAAGFVEIAHYYRPPGLPREQQPWLATVWRKSGS